MVLSTLLLSSFFKNFFFLPQTLKFILRKKRRDFYSLLSPTHNEGAKIRERLKILSMNEHIFFSYAKFKRKCKINIQYCNYFNKN